MKNEGKANNNAWKNEAKKLFKLPEEERKTILERMQVGKPEKAAFIRECIAKLQEAVSIKASEEAVKASAIEIVAVKTEEMPAASEKTVNTTIKAGLVEARNILEECLEIESRLDQKNPAPVEVKIEEKNKSPMKDRKPGDVLWERRPDMKKESNKQNDAPVGVIVIRRKEKKMRKLPSDVDQVHEEIQPTEQTSDEPAIYITTEDLMGNAPDRSFRRETDQGKLKIGKRYKVHDEKGNIKRFKVLIPAGNRERETKIMPAKGDKPAYILAAIHIPGTIFRINLNLRDGLAPKEDGTIEGEAEVGFIEMLRDTGSQMIQYINVFPANGMTGKTYQVEASLSRGQPKPGKITVGPSIGMFLRSNQDMSKTTDAEIFLHMTPIAKATQ